MAVVNKVPVIQDVKDQRLKANHSLFFGMVDEAKDVKDQRL